MHKLPDSTIKLISSSQVIASVHATIKELVENSIDAQATSIEVRLENFGLNKIEVIDNGCGIPDGEEHFVAKPHFTSKIRNEHDLMTFSSLGFRGEALHSICNVSDFSFSTKTESQSIGTLFSLDKNGNIIDRKPCSRQNGVHMIADNIFRNLPVRRQFFSGSKKGKDELKKIEDLLISFGLISPALRLLLKHNRSVIWQKVSCPSLKDSFISVFGVSCFGEMQQESFEDKDHPVKLKYMLPKACATDEICRKSNDRIFMYINKRPVMLKGIIKIIKSCCCEFVEALHNRYPIAFMSIDLPSSAVDVNVEPNKSVVLLEDMEVIKELIQKNICQFYKGQLKQLCSSSENTLHSDRINGSSDAIKNCGCLGESNEQSLCSKSTIKERDNSLSNSFSSLENLVNLDAQRHDPQKLPTKESSSGAVLEGYGLVDESRNYNWSEECEDKENEILEIPIENMTRKEEVFENETSNIDDWNGLWNLHENVFESNLQSIDSSPLDDNGLKTGGSSIEAQQLFSKSNEVGSSDLDIGRNNVYPTMECTSHNDRKMAGIEKGDSYSGIVDVPLCATESIPFDDEEVDVAKKLRLSTSETSSSGRHGSNISVLQTTIDSWSRGAALTNQNKGQYLQPFQILEPVAKNSKKRTGKNDCSKRETSSNIGVSLPPVISNNLEEYSVKFALDDVKRYFDDYAQSQHCAEPVMNDNSQIDVIGQVPPWKSWVIRFGKTLKFFNPSRAHEKDVFDELMKNHVLPSSVLQRSISLSETALEANGINGSRNWRYLVNASFERNAAHTGKCLVEKRITSNGFSIRQRRDVGSSETVYEIFMLTTAIENYGISDLNEIIDKIHESTATDQCDSLENYRPHQVERFFKDEAVRMARSSSTVFTKDGINDLVMKLASSTEGSEKYLCLHGKPWLIGVSNVSI